MEKINAEELGTPGHHYVVLNSATPSLATHTHQGAINNLNVSKVLPATDVRASEPGVVFAPAFERRRLGPQTWPLRISSPRPRRAGLQRSDTLLTQKASFPFNARGGDFSFTMHLFRRGLGNSVCCSVCCLSPWRANEASKTVVFTMQMRFKQMKSTT